jgi:hypothetical protein
VRVGLGERRRSRRLRREKVRRYAIMDQRENQSPSSRLRDTSARP